MAEKAGFVATAARGLEPLLTEEIQALGGEATAGRGMVECVGDWEMACRAALWSRLASRVLWPIAEIDASDPEALYAGVAAVAWEDCIDVSATLAVECNGTGAIGHTHFAALKVKDAVVDRLRAHCGQRPQIDTERPDLLLNLHLRGAEAVLYVDVGGGALHRRGYRQAAGAAPLRETLAAAVLWRAGWPQMGAGTPLLDPMCGAGTLVLEAALMAADIAPGLGRRHCGLQVWKPFPDEIWERLLEEAEKRREEGLKRLGPLAGWDLDGAVVDMARRNARAAGLEGRVRFETRRLGEAAPKLAAGPGLAVVNPPYGLRLGDTAGLEGVYARLGEDMRRLVPGWSLAVFTGAPRLAKMLRLKPRRSYSMANGPLRCRLMLYDLAARAPVPMTESSAGEKMLENRMRKNRKRLERLARADGVTCYRVYDADLPEYAVAVDLYRGERDWAHVQEYAPPSSIDPAIAAQRRGEALAVVGRVFEVAPGDVFFRVRRRQRGTAQYGRQGAATVEARIQEGESRLWVNFSEYLDTGIFLDHRLVRRRLAELARGGDLLNLFGYTAVATVVAAVGGVSRSLTVDLSPTYLKWAARNLALNGLDEGRHRLEQEDCMAWLRRQRGGRQFDAVFVNPPTFSNSKRTADAFILERDQGVLLGQALQLVRPGGTLLFSTHARRFVLDEEALKAGGIEIEIEETTGRMLPFDFAQKARAFRSWEIRRPR